MSLSPVSRPVVRSLDDGSVVGGWWVFARPVGMPIADISYFRGAPSTIGSFSFTDPGGPKDISLTFPGISMFDRLGRGDLYWLRKKVSIDIIWADLLPAVYPFGRETGPRAARVWVPSFAWEGRIESFSYGDAGVGMTVNGRGALIGGLDDYLAKPEFLSRPMPYEWAIARQFTAPDRPHLRLGKLQIQWPSWWDNTYTPPAKGTPHYLVPSGVRKGEKWTGLLTRSTGNWDSVWSSYMTTLLQAMYTPSGRWTLDLARGRNPVMSHRDMLATPDEATIIIDPVMDGHRIANLSVDWSESIDLVYAQGTSLAGVAYSGMEVTSDGARSFYTPMAARRQVYPTDDNDWLDLADTPREVMLQMLPGLSAYDAGKVAQAHLERFGDPGITGQIELMTDVHFNDEARTPLPHHLVRAGMSAVIPGLFGQRQGVTVHIAESSADMVAKKTTLTIDSKYRDALTVAEVRVRGRDALAIPRMLIAGQYTPPLPDQLLPWNYATGSGMIPSSPFRSARLLFEDMPDDLLFPWTPWTTTHPPRKGRWRHCYIKIPAASDNADNNWSGGPRGQGHGGKYGIGIRMSQAGSIRLLQLAAYDRDGNVMQIPFHVSFYYASGVNVAAMPKIPDNGSGGSDYPPYAIGQHYPFVVDAFEDYNSDGTLKSTEVPTTVRTALLWKAFGTNFVKAGYWPGDGSGDPTGLLVQENVGDFDTTKSGANAFDPYSPKGNLTNPDAGMLYVMIYADQQATEPVFFLGRMFRVEPGTNVGV